MYLWQQHLYYSNACAYMGVVCWAPPQKIHQKKKKKTSNKSTHGLPFGFLLKKPKQHKEGVLSKKKTQPCAPRLRVAPTCSALRAAGPAGLLPRGLRAPRGARGHSRGPALRHLLPRLRPDPRGKLGGLFLEHGMGCCLFWSKGSQGRLKWE